MMMPHDNGTFLIGGGDGTVWPRKYLNHACDVIDTHLKPNR